MKVRLPKRIAGVRVRRPLGRLAGRLPSRGRLMLGAAVMTPVVLGIASLLQRRREPIGTVGPEASSDALPAAAE